MRRTTSNCPCREREGSDGKRNKWHLLHRSAIRLLLKYSLLHLGCHLFIFKSQLMISLSRSLLPRSVKKRPRRLRLENETKCHHKCNRLYQSGQNANGCLFFTEYIYNSTSISPCRLRTCIFMFLYLHVLIFPCMSM